MARRGERVKRERQTEREKERIQYCFFVDSWVPAKRVHMSWLCPHIRRGHVYNLAIWGADSSRRYFLAQINVSLIVIPCRHNNKFVRECYSSAFVSFLSATRTCEPKLGQITLRRSERAQYAYMCCVFALEERPDITKQNRLLLALGSGCAGG
jgi:hypothetical protein